MIACLSAPTALLVFRPDMLPANPFPQVSAFLPSLPHGQIKRLRQVVEAGSPADSFACYCNLLEWLANHLANLCNSVYKDRPVDPVDERLEAVLRSLSSPLSFGTTVSGLHALSRGSFGLASRIPELATVLSHDRLPAACGRKIRAFQLIKRAREEFAVPPSHLEKYVLSQLPEENQLGRASLDGFLRNLIEFRNRGVGHQDEEGWFPRDQRMYALLNHYLAPAVDDLLAWEPMRELLTRYEIVKIEGGDTWPVGQARACTISRHYVADGFAPLGPSHILFLPTQRAEGTYIALRTPVAHELQAVVRYHAFPQTHQTSEQLYRRYARLYLTTYLKLGLITRPQRQGDLDPEVRKLAIPDAERSRIESEIQQAINEYTPSSPDRDQPLQRLSSLIGPDWPQIQAQVTLGLAQLPTQQKNHIFEQIFDKTIMSFEQLRSESELSEPELETVLSDLEQEGRVRRVGASLVDRAHGHYKTQDPEKPGTFREILESLRANANPRRRYPEFMWRLLELCGSVLSDDGLGLPEGELEGVRLFFEGSVGDRTATHEPTTGAMLLNVGDDTIHAESVRALYERVSDLLRHRNIDPSPAIPFLIGRTRYLVNSDAMHANGTAFAAPVAIGRYYFEANRNRDQALSEVVAFLDKLGIIATSPDLPDPGVSEVGDEVDDEAAAPVLGLEILAQGEEAPVVIQGRTVRQFFTTLLDHLLERSAPLDQHVPIRAGRVRYILAEEPYHANGRRFDSQIERGGYYMNTAFSYEQAMGHARALCEQLGLQTGTLDGASELQETEEPLRISIGNEVVEGEDVPRFLTGALTTLYARGLFVDGDIPYKSGRVRYLIAEVPTHDHGRAFIRPAEIHLGDRRYFIEANVSRQGALELIQRLLASKQTHSEPV